MKTNLEQSNAAVHDTQPQILRPMIEHCPSKTREGSGALDVTVGSCICLGFPDIGAHHLTEEYCDTVHPKVLQNFFFFF